MLTEDEKGQLEKAVKEYCTWANSQEGRIALRKQAAEARRSAGRIREISVVPDDVLRKRYTI
jgi:hypothetical protein